MAEKKLNDTVRYPTSLIVRGADPLGVEIAKSLLEQGGYVIIIDKEGEESRKQLAPLQSYKLCMLLDFSALETLDQDLRRLDYVFYLHHKSNDLTEKISTQEFLQFSNYLDSILDLGAKFEAKFLLTSSIRAHQLILASKQIDLNYEAGVEEKHSVYTEFEIQRYAESLVKEYEEKVGLDARIIRLGEILGKGLEVNRHSALVKIMTEAIEGKDMRIPGDGLDSDYYIHYLDAAYGILKAQFSMNTKGKIFTLANDEEITILSIAYKLMEIEPNAKDIVFDQNDHRLPPLKLYKPADNLTTIGWKPRVSFERALAQSVEYIKDELYAKGARKVTTEDGEVVSDDNEVGDETPAGPKTFANKVRDFFFVAETKEAENEAAQQASQDGLEGALGRLIAERKNQENARKGSIVLGNNKLRERLKPQKDLTVFQRIALVLNDFLYQLKKRFAFLRNLTLTDLFFLIIGFVGFVGIYFLLVSPVLSLVKDVYFIRQNLTQLSDAEEQFDLEKAKSANSSLKFYVSESQDRVKDLQYIFDLTQKHQLYLDTQNLLSNAVQYSTGYDEVFQALDPFATYLQQFKPGLLYRFSDSNILTATPTQDYTALLRNINDNTALMRVGINRVEKSQDDLVSYLDKMPQQIQDLFKNQVATVNNKYQDYHSLQQAYEFVPVLLGNSGAKNYLIVVQDNARYTAGGGEIAGFILIKMENGAIKDISVKTVNQYPATLTGVKDEVFSAIKLVSNKIITASNIRLKDLSLIGNDSVLLQTLQDFVAQQEGKKIDMTMSVNLSTLEALLRSHGPLDYKQVSFNNNNLLANINLLIGDSKNDSTRNEIIMNLFAEELDRESAAFSTDVADVLNTMASERLSRDLRLYSNNLDFSNYLSATGAQSESSSDIVSFGLNYSQDSLIMNKYPVITTSVKVTVHKDFTTDKTIEISSSGVENIQNSYVCVASGSKDISYTVPSDIVSKNFDPDQICSIFLKTDDLKYKMSLNTLSFENKGGSRYNYSLELVKNPGIGSVYDIEFDFDPSLIITPEDTSFIKQGGNYLYSGAFVGNKIFRFELK